MSDLVKNFKSHLKSTTQTVKPIGVFKKERIGFVEAEYGLNDTGDYVWHFSPFYRSKPFPSDPTLFIRIIQTYLGSAIPSEVKVDVYLPPSTWERKVFSVLAREVGKKWNFNEDMLTKPIKKICDHMTEEISRQNPRRTNL